MSEVTQIRFIKNEGNAIQICDYSDNTHPNAVIPELYDFFKWYYSEPNSRQGDYPDYVVANFIYYEKKKLSEYGNGEEKLGYGIEKLGDLDGEEEYIYEVDLTDAEKPEEIKIRYSDDFKSFSKAKWHPWTTLGKFMAKLLANQ